VALGEENPSSQSFLRESSIKSKILNRSVAKIQEFSSALNQFKFLIQLRKIKDKK
jgi:hypothetical protein